MRLKLQIFLITWLFFPYYLFAQLNNPDYIEKISLEIDTLAFTSVKDTIGFKGKSYMFFQYSKENEICDIKIYPSKKHKLKHISILESGDFKMIDSLLNFNNQYFTFKVQFSNLSKSDFLRFRIKILADSTEFILEIPLLPITSTTAKLNIKNDELSVAEEKVFELVSNHPENIVITREWQTYQDIDYRLSENNGQVFLHLLPNSAGNKVITINLRTNKPYWQYTKLSCDLTPITFSLNVKTAGLVYLQIDKNDITLDDKSKNEGIEIQLDNNRYLELNSVYLVEAKEAPGSPLIAEIFTKEKLSNSKILCLLRVFNYHRKSDGYLYIKDNNQAKFISNFNVIPRVTIEHIKVMRNGKDWIEDASIYPGETINLKLEGQSLDKARFQFAELINLSGDSMVRNENFVEYRLKIPIDISKKTIEIFNYNQNTGKYLSVKEYQKSHSFNYITINYGSISKNILEINGPELYDKTIKDLVISFNPNKIDSANNLYGKQYLTIDVKILGKKNEIVDFTTLENISVCPGENSPRYSFYDKSDCKYSEISLNSKITNTTYSLKDWSKIKLTFRNPLDKHPQDAQNKTVEVVLQKHFNFDIDVSFPTGLLIKKASSSDYANFGGVSMAVIGQFSFFQKDKINKLRPYKIGAGFLALNAFNFSSDASSRDVGAVVLCTINPINRDRKLVFSLYLGGGYLLSSETMFWLLGPGFSVQL